MDTVEVLGLKIGIPKNRDEVKEFFYKSAFHHKPMKVGFVDSESFVSAFLKKKVRQILSEFDVLIPSSVGVKWALKVLRGEEEVQRIPQLRFLLDVAEMSDREGFTMFLLSKKHSWSRKAGEQLRSVFKNLKIVGATSHSRDDVKDAVLVAVRKSQPHFLFVDMDSPKGEKWIVENFSSFFPTSIAVASKDALRLMSGARKTAPFWMQEKGLEWLYRFVKNPFNLSRAFKLAVFPLVVMWIKFRERKKNDRS